MTELEQLKAENARLRAALEGQSGELRLLRVCTDQNAIHDLLTPTIELLKRVESFSGGLLSGDATKELTRLRVLTERKE